MKLYIADDSASEATLPAFSICVYVKLHNFTFTISTLTSFLGRKFHKAVKTACSHRRHHKLENLRTLLLGDNKLTVTSLWLDEGAEEEGENHSNTTHKSKLLFPNLGALDLSNNKIREIPNALNEMSNLSVFNVSGNSG